MNTEHQKSKLLTFQKLFCLVFKWSDHVIRQTIPITDILDHKTDIFVQFSDHHSKSGELDMFGQFQCQTCPIFRWLL